MKELPIMFYNNPQSAWSFVNSLELKEYLSDYEDGVFIKNQMWYLKMDDSYRYAGLYAISLYQKK